MAVVIAQNISLNTGESASLTPTLRLNASVPTGDYILAFVAHADPSLPGLPTDSQGNVYRFLGGDYDHSGIALGGCWYGAKAVSTSRPTLTFHNAAASVYGVYVLSGYALNTRGGVQEAQVQVVDPTTNFTNGADSQSTGDFLASLIIAPQAVTFTVDPSTPGWTDDLDVSSANVSAQVLHAIPGSAGNLPIIWNSSGSVTAILASISIAHS